MFLKQKEALEILNYKGNVIYGWWRSVCIGTIWKWFMVIRERIVVLIEKCLLNGNMMNRYVAACWKKEI